MTITFFVVGLTNEVAEDRLLPRGEERPPPEPFVSLLPCDATGMPYYDPACGGTYPGSVLVFGY